MNRGDVGGWLRSTASSEVAERVRRRGIFGGRESSLRRYEWYESDVATLTNFLKKELEPLRDRHHDRTMKTLLLSASSSLSRCLLLSSSKSSAAGRKYYFLLGYSAAAGSSAVMIPR